MRRYLLAAVAAAAVASPAVARDNAGYVGIEGGIIKAQDLQLDYEDSVFNLGNAVEINHDYGLDGDIIGGYDFGAFRAEGEVAYKRVSIDTADFESRFLPPNVVSTPTEGRGTALSLMANAMLDFGGDDEGEGITGYAGGGIGFANVKYRLDADAIGIGFRDSDSGLAWQLIAGIRAPVSPSIDVGLKYRYFRTMELEFGDDEGLGDRAYTVSGRWVSHSLLASLIFNFVAPPAPEVVAPPPPPPPPATQTCPDGSVILATDVCPAPPPPPPPPPPAGERG